MQIETVVKYCMMSMLSVQPSLSFTINAFPIFFETHSYFSRIFQNDLVLSVTMGTDRTGLFRKKRSNSQGSSFYIALPYPGGQKKCQGATLMHPGCTAPLALGNI